MCETVLSKIDFFINLIQFLFSLLSLSPRNVFNLRLRPHQIEVILRVSIVFLLLSAQNLHLLFSSARDFSQYFPFLFFLLLFLICFLLGIFPNSLSFFWRDLVMFDDPSIVLFLLPDDLSNAIIASNHEVFVLLRWHLFQLFCRRSRPVF